MALEDDFAAGSMLGSMFVYVCLQYIVPCTVRMVRDVVKTMSKPNGP